MAEEKKICKCANPKIVTQPPLGFSGTMRCPDCGGLFDYPRKAAKYQGTDEIAAYLFDLDANSKAMSFEKAVIKMLLRIESALKTNAIIPGSKTIQSGANKN
jgi:hypothetical protein